MKIRRGVSAAIIFLAAGAVMSATVVAQPASVDYRVSFENAVHHEAEITVTFKDLGEAPLVARMSRSSPGRYALHEFAKNVYSVSAVGAAGQSLEVTRSDPYSWRVDGHDGEVTLTYTLFADRADGTYSQIDLTHAHLNIPATFMWADGLEDRPITVSFSPPDRSWKAATQLPRGRGDLRFTAPNLYYFLDSPIELSDFDIREWKLDDGQTIRLAVHHEGNSEDMDRFAEKAKNIVEAQIDIFGEAPAFDYGEYTFIADYLPHASGDGMEHRNSTILSRTDGLYEGDFAHIGTLSHEFVHVWNVERLRPAELEPFDFSRANPTPSLWFAEGFTNYFGDLAIVRAGEWDLEEYLENLSGAFSSVVNAPGRAFGSPQSMSLQAPFVDAARSVDPVNRANIFVSYYTYGEIIALALDLTLRQNFEDITLDDYMRHMWVKFGKSETPYTHDDLRQALGEVTGDAAFAREFFASYIEGGDLPDFEPLLAQAGLRAVSVNPEKTSLGRVQFEEKGDALVVASTTLIGTPLYDAGIGQGDEIRRIGRFHIDSEKDYERALKRHEPGEEAVIEYRQRSETKKASVTFQTDTELKITAIEDNDGSLNEAHEEFRESWLNLATEEES